MVTADFQCSLLGLLLLEDGNDVMKSSPLHLCWNVILCDIWVAVISGSVSNAPKMAWKSSSSSVLRQWQRAIYQTHDLAPHMRTMISTM